MLYHYCNWGFLTSSCKQKYKHSTDNGKREAEWNKLHRFKWKIAKYTKYPRKAFWILIAATPSVGLLCNWTIVVAWTSTGSVWTAGTGSVWTAGTGSSTTTAVATLTRSWLVSISEWGKITSGGGRGGAALSVSDWDAEVCNFCFPNHFFFGLLVFCKSSC